GVDTSGHLAGEVEAAGLFWECRCGRLPPRSWCRGCVPEHRPPWSKAVGLPDGGSIPPNAPALSMPRLAASLTPLPLRFHAIVWFHSRQPQPVEESLQPGPVRSLARVREIPAERAESLEARALHLGHRNLDCFGCLPAVPAPSPSPTPNLGNRS